MIRPVMPDLSGWQTDTGQLLFQGALMLAAALVAAACISGFAFHKWQGHKRRLRLLLVGMTAVYTTALLWLFGCSAITVRGIILCLILLVSSYADIRSRECDDWLHVMIVITAFIGSDTSQLFGRFLSAAATGGLLLLPVLLCKNKIGGADIKCAMACSFLLGFTKGIGGLCIGLVIAILVNALRNKEKRRTGFPLIPYLTAGYLAVYLILGGKT